MAKKGKILIVEDEILIADTIQAEQSVWRSSIAGTRINFTAISLNDLK